MLSQSFRFGVTWSIHNINIYKECARVTITDVVIIKFYLRTSNVVYYVTWMDYALCILSAYIIDIYIDV